MRRPETDEPKKDMTLNVSQRTFDWVNRVAKAERKSRSWIIEELLLDHLPEEYQNEI
jgi:predicted transcriptional regulator